ncbi:hypothetical protein [Natrinema soli]|uniref:DUF4145 domain-containing protein n=1 Tax=Natrinema soli TaxID=1930624 RepID=A0ABD5SHK2_9EURY|nr:hypothetical protein [Natrinema soli]
MSDYPPVAKMTYDDGRIIGMEINEEWWESSKQEYLDFRRFKQNMTGEWAEDSIVNYEKLDGLSGLIVDPPENWLEKEHEDEELVEGEASFLDLRISLILNIIRDKALKTILDQEIAHIENLIGENDFKTAIIRQSAFFEEFLAMTCVVKLGRNKKEALSNKDLGIVEQMGHSDRIRLARILRVINEKQHQRLQEMASMRNEIAHTPWTEFGEDKEKTIQRIATKSFEVMDQLSVSMDEKLSFY